MIKLQLDGDEIPWLRIVIWERGDMGRGRYTEKKVSDFPVSSRDVNNQTLHGQNNLIIPAQREFGKCQKNPARREFGK